MSGILSENPQPPPPGWRRRIVNLLVAQLRQGTTPHQLALTLALGCVLAMFPILGATTLLCAVAAGVFGLNQPFMQIINYGLGGVQLLMLIPFYRAGEWLFSAPPVPLVDIASLFERFEAGPWQFMRDYGLVAAYGVVVWLLFAPVAALLIFVTARPALERIARTARGQR